MTAIVKPRAVGEPELPEPTLQRVGLEDFTFLQVLGKGSFGKVRLLASACRR